MNLKTLKDNNAQHVGDGAYAFIYYGSVVVATERENGWHWVSLEPQAIREVARMADFEIKEVKK